MLPLLIILVSSQGSVRVDEATYGMKEMTQVRPGKARVEL